MFLSVFDHESVYMAIQKISFYLVSRRVERKTEKLKEEMREGEEIKEGRKCM